MEEGRYGCWQEVPMINTCTLLIITPYANNLSSTTTWLEYGCAKEGADLCEEDAEEELGNL
jgi:hypothetical protein